jgi:hypothetical protein
VATEVVGAANERAATLSPTSVRGKVDVAVIAFVAYTINWFRLKDNQCPNGIVPLIATAPVLKVPSISTLARVKLLESINA